MSAPLYEKLLAHSRSADYPFAMPGHKGRGLFPWDWRMDVTELSGFDNLHAPEGVLLEAEQKLAALCGAEESFFLVGGSSSGLIAGILALCNPGDTLLVARNCHVSVFRGLVLAGVRPVYLLPETTDGIVGALSADTVAAAVKAHPQARGLVLTSPTYEGHVSDLLNIGKVLHDAGMVLLVDEAHGAHFGYHPLFPLPAMALGADIAVQSWHKTLPVPTQAAVLHCRGRRIDRRRLKQALKTAQTTSPSYFFMAALDKCRDWLETEGVRAFAAYADNLVELRRSISGLPHIRLLETADPGKLVLRPGKELERGLLGRGLYLEAASLSHCLAMTSVGDTKADFNRLFAALEALDKEMGPVETMVPVQSLYLPELVLPPREAYFSEGETVSLDEGEGRIALDFIIPYPPGIPLLAPGERISREALVEIKGLKAAGIPVLGAEADIFVKKQ